MQIAFQVTLRNFKSSYSFANFQIIKQKYIAPIFEGIKPPLLATQLYEEQYCNKNNLSSKSLNKQQKASIKSSFGELSAEEKQKIQEDLKQRKTEYKSSLTLFTRSISPPPGNPARTKILRSLVFSHPNYTIQEQMKFANIRMSQMKQEEKDKQSEESKIEKLAYAQKYQIPQSKKISAYNIFQKQYGIRNSAQWTAMNEQDKQQYVDKAIDANQEIEDQWKVITDTYNTTKFDILNEVAKQYEIKQDKLAKLKQKKIIL